MPRLRYVGLGTAYNIILGGMQNHYLRTIGMWVRSISSDTVSKTDTENRWHI